MQLRTPTLVFVSSILLAPGAWGGTAADAPDGASPKRLTLRQTTGSEAVSFAAKLPGWSWTDDGNLLTTGSGEDQRWVEPRSGEEVPAPPEAKEDASDAEEVDEDAVRRALEGLDGVDEDLAKRISKKTPKRGEAGQGMLFDHDDVLWFVDGGVARCLAPASPAKREFVDLAPDGERVAFVMDNDLYLVDTATGEEHRVTDNGGPEAFNGKLDWVYQEEIYGRGRFKAFAWSPSSTHVAFLSLDESPVHEFTVIDHIEEGHRRVRPEITNYPKAGDPNPIAALGVASVTDGSVVWMDLAPFAAEEPLIVRFDWSPDGERLLVCVQDRLQTWAKLQCVDPATGSAKTWIHETSDAWVNRPESPRWLEDGTFLWESERTGYNHLYRYSGEGELLGAVTSGEWAVRSVLELDEEAGQVWFTSTKDGAVNVNVYRAGLDGSAPVRLTSGAGSHTISFNGDRSLFVDRFSSLEFPGEVRLCDAGDGRVLRVLDEAEVAAEADYALARWESIQIPARDGFLLDAAILKPADFDPGVAHPVWIPTYSGPDAPSVRNRWNSSAWYQFLAQEGVIVLQVNVRTASGRGRWSTALGYKRFGVLELQDLVDAANWATAHPWADAERVGITGYSYGGFISAYALCKSKTFALGIAGGGVYEWSMYDTIYTERYMSTPEKNPEGYAETSAVLAAPDLHGRLVMHHGTMDDNVHLQNAMHMIYALQKAGKSFDLMLYPETRHGVRDKDQAWHLRNIEWDAIQEVLQPGRGRG